MADVIINKTTSIIMSLSASLQTDDRELLKDTARESLSNACELSNWIKYLQIVPDLLTLSTLVLDSNSVQKRKEIRYPVPAELEGRINVLCDDMFEARLVNFSQSGMQILSDRPIREGSILRCRLITDVEEGTPKTFRATAMYCAQIEDSYICGALISDIHGNGGFNFFNAIYQLILDYTGEAITAGS